MGNENPDKEDSLQAEDYVQLKGATEVYDLVAKRGLYLVSVVNQSVPDLKLERGYLDRVEMGGHIDILVDGEQASRAIGEKVARQTGRPVGIAKYDGLASLAHSNALVAIDMAAHEGKSVFMYDEKEDPIELAARNFMGAEQRL